MGIEIELTLNQIGPKIQFKIGSFWITHTSLFRFEFTIHFHESITPVTQQQWANESLQNKTTAATSHQAKRVSLPSTNTLAASLRCRLH